MGRGGDQLERPVRRVKAIREREGYEALRGNARGWGFGRAGDGNRWM